jgi:geranylgeranyl pyrophosphate synthase
MKNQPSVDDFAAEIQEVQTTLLGATNDLNNPLGDLVRAQIKRSQPPICAAVVLAVATPTPLEQESAQQDGDLHHKRILLAAALEMLHIALNVHRLLVNAALRQQQGGNGISLDRSFIGSTILAGDYCFSRAAQMAARTDHPRVVATFSMALQTVSEGLLREQFHSGEDGAVQKDSGQKDIERYSTSRYDETRQLLRSGAQAAALLAGLSESDQEQAIALSQELASHWALYQQGQEDKKWQEDGRGAGIVPIRWQTLYHWLSQQPIHSETPIQSPYSR